MPRYLIIPIIICTLSLSECRNNSNEHTIPDVRVNIDIDVNLPQYNNLNFIGGWVYLKGGYNGIIVHRSTVDVLAAYERQAPYLVEEGCRIDVDSNGVTCRDHCSGSEWLLFDGQLVKGPAPYPLKQYRSSFDGVRLSIRN
ncbi:MAG TPA: hypothetical protein DCX14_01915 [Flavobacteriales bacterium]|jgi:hypothetical protein|nr:hypothetical protein [Flavobacteriales bacterium]HAW18912.1 hypothetical protein [Flavobacteriales bacterium]